MCVFMFTIHTYSIWWPTTYTETLTLIIRLCNLFLRVEKRRIHVYLGMQVT